MKTFAIGDLIQCSPEETFYPGMLLKIYDKYPSCFENNGQMVEHRNSQRQIIYIYRLEITKRNQTFLKDIKDFELLKYHPQLITPAPQEPHCCCTSFQLFQEGCRCGAFYQR